MKIRRISSDETQPKVYVQVFLQGDDCWVEVVEEDGFSEHFEGDATDVRRLLEDAKQQSAERNKSPSQPAESSDDGKEAWRTWVLQGVGNGWYDGDPGYKRDGGKFVDMKCCGDGTWDVWFGDQLLCKTVGRTGAYAIKHVLESFVAENPQKS